MALPLCTRASPPGARSTDFNARRTFGSLPSITWKILFSTLIELMYNVPEIELPALPFHAVRRESRRAMAVNKNCNPARVRWSLIFPISSHIRAIAQRLRCV